MAQATRYRFEHDLEELIGLLSAPPERGSRQDHRLTHLLMDVQSHRGEALRLLPRDDPMRRRLDELNHRIEDFARDWEVGHEVAEDVGLGPISWRLEAR